jgi:hypothetical protein
MTDEECQKALEACTWVVLECGLYRILRRSFYQPSNETLWRLAGGQSKYATIAAPSELRLATAKDLIELEK